MAANEPIRPPEAITTGAGAAGAAGRAAERAAAAEPVVTPVAAPEVTIYRPAVSTRLVSLSRSAGHYAGTAVALVRRARHGEIRGIRQEAGTREQAGIRERAEQMVREKPAVLAGAVAAGYIVGRVLMRL